MRCVGGAHGCRPRRARKRGRGAYAPLSHFARAVSPAGLLASHPARVPASCTPRVRPPSARGAAAGCAVVARAARPTFSRAGADTPAWARPPPPLSADRAVLRINVAPSRCSRNAPRAVMAATASRRRTWQRQRARQESTQGLCFFFVSATPACALGRRMDERAFLWLVGVTRAPTKGSGRRIGPGLGLWGNPLPCPARQARQDAVNQASRSVAMLLIRQPPPRVRDRSDGRERLVPQAFMLIPVVWLRSSISDSCECFGDSRAQPRTERDCSNVALNFHPKVASPLVPGGEQAHLPLLPSNVCAAWLIHIYRALAPATSVVLEASSPSYDESTVPQPAISCTCPRLGTRQLC